MVRSLSVMYLHRANRLDAKRLPLMEYGLTDAFRDFCRETFDTQAALDYPPLKLVVANSTEALAKALFTSAGPRSVLTELGRACCLFVIDDELLSTDVEGRSLRDWLKLFFPAIPKVVLTRPAGHRKTPENSDALYRAVYGRSYPALVHCMADQAESYNATMEYIEAAEAAGECFVIRPTQDLQVSRTERDAARLREQYALGRRDAFALLPALREYLGL